MSGPGSIAAAPRAGRAAQAINQANDGVGKWLQDLVTGQGTSPAQIIVTGVIGVVPGLGQAFDVRDLVLGIIALTRSPANPLVWVDLLITLVGCIPALGDAFKVCFKLVRQGHGIGRVLDALRAVLKGDVDRWLRTIDWTMVSRRSKATLNDVLDAFIGALDTWAVKVLAGRGAVNDVIGELRRIKEVAPRRLDEALEELKRMHRKILDDMAPASTAARNPPSGPRAGAASGPAVPPAPQSRPSGSAPRRTDATPDNTGTPNARKQDQARESKQRRDNWQSGVLPEHITDYHIARRNTNFRKINDGGRKMEEHDKMRGAGIDHVWRNTSASTEVFASSGGKGGKPYVVGETKGSLLGSFAFLAALPADLKQHFDALRADEAAGNSPNAFGNDARDTAPAKKVEITTDQGLTKGGIDEYGRRQQGLNRANDATGLPTQMSHHWIARNLETDSTLVAAEARGLRQAVREFARGRMPAPPYQRWVFMVTGRQKSIHESSKTKPPHRHEIQRPIVVIPDALLER